MKTGFFRRLLCLLTAVTLLCGVTAAVADDTNGRVTLSVLTFNSANCRNFMQAVTARFPQVDWDIEYYAGPNGSENMAQKLANGEVPDLVFATNLFADTLQQGALLDLSGYEFASRYSEAYLAPSDIDGHVYLLPAVCVNYGLFYNKTVLEEHGWAVPTTAQELAELCAVIRAETDMTPIAVTGKFAGTWFRMVTTHSQAGYLGTPDGAEWETAFQQGNASAEEGFGEGLRVLQLLIDADAFDSYSVDEGDAATYGHLLAREAVFGWTIGNMLYFMNETAGSGDAFGMIPYYGINEGDQILTSTVGFRFGLGKQLAEAGNEKKLAQALEVMDYLSSEEGQAALMTDASCISPLKTGTGTTDCSFYADVAECIEADLLAPYLYTGYEDIVVQMGDAVKAAVYETKDALAVADIVDRAKAQASSGENALAIVTETLTTEQTAQLMANMLLEQTGVDTAAVVMNDPANRAYNPSAVYGHLFAGEILSNNYNTCLPAGVNTKLVTLSLTGAQLKTLLAEGFTVGAETVTVAPGAEPVTKDFTFAYAAAGATDGLDETKTYTVAMVAGTFDAEKYADYTETGAALGQTFLSWLEAHPTISPADAEKR